MAGKLNMAGASSSEVVMAASTAAINGSACCTTSSNRTPINSTHHTAALALVEQSIRLWRVGVHKTRFQADAPGASPVLVMRWTPSPLAQTMLP
jgi:hypothetical protein